jgi:hypothetical protein
VNSLYTTPSTLGAGATTVNGPFSTYLQEYRTGAMLSVGAGVDMRMASRFSLRVAADYDPTFLDNSFSGSGIEQNNVRFHVGLLFHNAYDRK